MIQDHAHRAIAVVGVGAVLPDAKDAKTFWRNIESGRYSIVETPRERWDPDLYYDENPKAEDKTYSKIGGWVREYDWNPLQWKLPIPPRVSDALDLTQKWGIIAVRETLTDYGRIEELDRGRTAVILGNAMAGDRHYRTALRAFFPEYAEELNNAPGFATLPAEVRTTIMNETLAGVRQRFPDITEDTMPGELANVIAGRIAAMFDLHGPNFIVDAACASAMAAVNTAVEGLEGGAYDAVLTGGIDGNMSASSFIKFSKIGALSATGTRPFDAGADGFVMGEGAVVMLLKRLEDAEEAGDRIYAVIRGVGGSSDGRGKGITAPNPVGQKLAIERAWLHAGCEPTSATLIEAHGTSTRVGDVAELSSLAAVWADHGVKTGETPIGSVKSNFGHLKGAAGAAGLLKAVLAVHHKMLPPSLGMTEPNPKIDFDNTPFAVNKELRAWNETGSAGVRRAGVSAFGFGGTNFHAVVEEHIPGRITRELKARPVAVPMPLEPVPSEKKPLRGLLVVGGSNETQVKARLSEIPAPPREPPAASDLAGDTRLAIDFEDRADFEKKRERVLEAFGFGNPAAWKMLRAQGAFLRDKEQDGKVAFLYPGQGSQYVNMLRDLWRLEPVVKETFDEADAIMAPFFGRPLTDIIFVEPGDEAKLKEAESQLRQTAITQPAVLAVNVALTRLLGAYGITPDFVMGHSLGEYAALVAAGALPFADALEAVSARGREMTRVSVKDNGLMAAVMAPLEEVERAIAQADGYAVIANINSGQQAVIGGSTSGVTEAVSILEKAGHRVVMLPVSHAFHTEIVAPASQPLMQVLARLALESPQLPIVSNVTGEFYPMGPRVKSELIDLLGRQIASPVQFVKGLETLYAAGTRVFVEVGPKRALHGFVEDVLGDRDVLALLTNHPKIGDVVSFNQALAGLYASGRGHGRPSHRGAPVATPRPPKAPLSPPPGPAMGGDGLAALGRIFADAMARAGALTGVTAPPARSSIVVSGAALGLPGGSRVFEDENVERVLRGDTFIDTVPLRLRESMVQHHITRLVKTGAGGPRFESIESTADVIKLAARAGTIGLDADFGYPKDRVDSLDSTTELAIAAGIEALHDAGIPLVLHYKTTTKGTKLPDRWGLPDGMKDETGIIFASAFPGYDRFAQDLEAYYEDRALRRRRDDLRSLRTRLTEDGGDHALALREIDRHLRELDAELERRPHSFDRKFIFRILAMGHSQFAEYIGARGPNTQINAACASGTQAVALAEDWINAGRCQRVVIVSSDNVTSDHLMGWIGSGFLASGAAATDDVLEEVALPFDRRRHGLLLGMGACAVVVESQAACAARGLSPITEVLGTVTANSAFHGTQLDVEHICAVMERLVAEVEVRHGLSRAEIAQRTVFISHETYTPARGGSAQAEVFALRRVFGDVADRIVIANTKGMTGHAMGAGVEDAVAVKILETGIVPPIANFKEVDPELGALNLSKGGTYPVEFALRLGAGFGSQICMSLMRWVPPKDGERRPPHGLGYAYRIADRPRFEAYLRAASGHEAPELEVECRTLRFKDHGPAGALGRAEPIATGGSLSPSTPVVKAPPAPARQRVPESGPGAAPVEGRTDPIEDRVLKIVSEKTGYPPEMLDADLDLEADLGIDTVKQAETFAAVRDAYDIPKQENLQLRDFPTMKHVVQFVHDHRPDLAAESVPPAAGPSAERSASAPAPEGGGVESRVLGIVAEKTGYPPEMLDLDLDLEADLGVDTVKQAETFAAVREAYDIPTQENLQLRDFPTMKHVVQFVHDHRPDLAAESAAPAAGPSAEDSASVPGPEDDGVENKVLGIVAEKTGYPPEMLDLDLDLEADLGVDTVKQAETFAAVREVYDIPKQENLQLRDFPTMRHVVGFVRDHRPAVPARDEPAAVVESSGGPEAMPPSGVLRRVPVAVLRPPLASTRPTGVELGNGSRVFVMPDAGGVGDKLIDRLTTKGVEVVRLDPHADLVSQLAGAAQGVFWLPALDIEDALEDLEPSAFDEAVRIRVKTLYQTMRTLYDRIGDTGTFLVAATRLGGRHGFDDAGAVAPLGGAVAGFTKTFKREKPHALVKVVDFAKDAENEATGELLIAETLADPGVVEVGYVGGLRMTVALEERAIGEDERVGALSRASTFVVTGAAGSIVSAIVEDLAMASGGGTFHLLDLAPKPDPHEEELALFRTDRDALKRRIFERLKARGERATPVQVEKEIARLERKEMALSAIRAIEAAGGTAHYHAVDVLDADAVQRALADVERVDALIHAAGLEVSRFLPDKKPEEFDLVFDVKAKGWFNVLRALAGKPIGATIGFSSIAGRFGNAGQTDYSAANELLAKTATSFRSTRPHTRGITIDWTAWAEIGMASRGSIPKMMELAGIDMLPPAEGIAIVRRELEYSSGEEVVVARGLGVLLDEWDDRGGLHTERHTPVGPMTTRLTGMALHRGLTVEADLDPTVQGFLADHVLDGTPILPGVMGIEMFAELATALLPDWHVAAVEEVAFLAPFKFYRQARRVVNARAQFVLEGDDVVGHCLLEGDRKLAHRDTPQRTTHFTGRVRLAKARVVLPQGEAPPAPKGPCVDSDRIYRVYFHGPAYRVVQSAWRQNSVVVGRMAANLPPAHTPPEPGPTLLPRLIELCFQTAGIHEIGKTGKLGLPNGLDRVRCSSNLDNVEGTLYAVVTPKPQGTYDAVVTDERGNVFVELVGYRTIALPAPVPDDLRAPFSDAMG